MHDSFCGLCTVNGWRCTHHCCIESGSCWGYIYFSCGFGGL
jgi:hypothetical protein